MSKRIIEDSKVFTVWKCEDCSGAIGENEVEVNVDFFQDNGTPVCSECDCDMSYWYTYIVGVEDEN